MDVTDHLHGMQRALDAFLEHAQRAGLDRRTVTAPDWTVHELAAHLGMVHRWAAAFIGGRRVDPATVEAEGLLADDPLDWLRHGAEALTSALDAAPGDLEVRTFLADPPPPRQFWARRQCHETTMHAVDALSAELGRMPRAEDTWIARALAVDGIDELLTGFLPRRHSRLRSETPLTVAVRPDDDSAGWLVHLSEEQPVTERARNGSADLVLEAPAVSLYLTLWNRGDAVTGEDFGFWREGARVSWN